MGSGESGIGNRESGIGNRESGIGSRESGIGSREINRRVGSGCCLKLASSREYMISHCPPTGTFFSISVMHWQMRTLPSSRLTVVSVELVTLY
uniref:Uncharacterized protein n=1 Tax=Moorena producens (strain JHB) TaxID=1454205 RepID=A0A1D9G3K1_MOOP1